MENQSDKPRTAQQNRALHKYFELLADSLNAGGLDMKVVLKETISIDWTKEGVKNYLWKPVQEAIIGDRSTTKLSTKDIDKIFDWLNKHLSEKFGKFVSLPMFPSVESNFLDETITSSKIKRTH